MEFKQLVYLLIAAIYTIHFMQPPDVAYEGFLVTAFFIYCCWYGLAWTFHPVVEDFLGLFVFVLAVLVEIYFLVFPLPVFNDDYLMLVAVCILALLLFGNPKS